MTGNPLLDIDTPEYVTLAQAMEITGRSRRTILRWHEAGQVERIRKAGMRVYNLWDLEIAVRNEGKRRARPKGLHQRT